jgi:hypothetical protein
VRKKKCVDDVLLDSASKNEFSKRINARFSSKKFSFEDWKRED